MSILWSDRADWRQQYWWRLALYQGRRGQGHVVSPRLFSCGLEVMLGCWRRKIGNAGMDLQDGMHTLLDEIRRRRPSFFTTYEGTKFWLDELVTCLAEVDLQLNVGKTKILTTQPQSRSELLLRNGHAIDVFDRVSVGMHALHRKYWQSLQIWHITCRVRRRRFMHRPLLVNRNITMRDRVRYVDAMVTPVACFGFRFRFRPSESKATVL